MPNAGGEFRGGTVHGHGSVDAFKKTFFDREAVQKAVDAAIAKQLSRFGAFVRQRARTSLRYREEPSPPGTPPSAHKSMLRLKPAKKKKTDQPDPPRKVQAVSPLRDFLFFGYEKADQTVVIGPAKTNQVFFDHNREPVTGTVPGVLERGGQITILEVRKNGRWQRADLRSKRRLAGLQTRYRTVTIAPRPYMQPAFDQEIGKFLTNLKDSVTPTG